MTDENRDWALWDFTKVGLSDYRGGIWTVYTTESYTQGKKKLYKLEFDRETAGVKKMIGHITVMSVCLFANSFFLDESSSVSGFCTAVSIESRACVGIVNNHDGCFIS